MSKHYLSQMPFLMHERRELKLDAAKLDPKCLAKGKAPKAFATYAAARLRRTHRCRVFRLEIGGLADTAVRLHHGDAGDAEWRLTAIAEDLLAPPDPEPPPKGKDKP